MTLLAKSDRLLVSMKSIIQPLVEVGPYLLLMGPDPVQVALLYGSPGIHQVLLKEFSSIEEGVWVSQSMHCTVGIVAELGDVLGAALTIRTWLGWDGDVEARVTSREEQDIVEW